MQQAQNRVSDQKRREDARAQCHMKFALYAPDIKHRMPKREVERFIDKYMDDLKPASEVEKRGKELCHILEQLRQAVKPHMKPRTIAQLSEWYLTEKRRIESLSIEPRIKQSHLAQLDMRYAELTQQLLENMNPCRS